MKSFLVMMLAVLVVTAMAVPAMAQEEGKKAGTKEMKKAELPEGFKAQETCPVMGGKITETSYVDYQGQRVYFCCPGCEDPFLKDPDKFFEQAAKDKVMFENVQTTCPVSGEPIDRQYFTYYKGRGIYFCCADCVKKFEAEPEKYLEKMGGEMKKGKCEGHEKEKKCKGHEEDHGHDHDHEG